MTTARWLAAIVVLAGTAAQGACSTPTESVESAAGPDPSTFAPVADVLVARCGSIDCHGSRYRNMRLYGFGGTRLDPKAQPDTGTSATPDEVSADYEAVVGLEPAIMSQVTADHGQNPERLTFIRKGRGQENHKGGAPIAVGDPADLCVLSWLEGHVDTGRCKTAFDAH
jgi:hypothetical protein